MSSKKYSRDFKLKVLEYYFEHGGDKKFGLKAKTAHHFCIDHKTVSRMLCNPDIVKKARRILLKKNGTEGSKNTKHSSLKIGQPFVNVQKIDSDFNSKGKNVSSSSKPSQSSKKVAASHKSPEVQIIDLPEDPDYSLLKKAIDSSASSVANIAKLLFTGTDEVKRIITNECDLIYECKICRNLFRSVVNFLAHKRIYCQEEYVNVKGSFYKNTGLNMTSESSTVIVEPEPPPDSPPIIEDCKESSLKVDQIAARLAKNKTKQPAQETSHPSHKGSSKYFQSIEEVNHSRKSLSSDCSVVLRDIAGVSSAVYQAINQPGNKVTRRSTNHQRKSDRPVQLDPAGQVIDRNKVSESLPLPEKTAVICKEEPPDDMEVTDFSCSSCELTFSSQSLLNAHVEQVHGIERTVYTCPICNMTFFSIWGCVKHLIRIHKKKKHQRERLKHVICSRAYKKTFTAKEIVKQNYKSAAQILKDFDKKEESAPSSPSSVSSLQDAKSSEREDFPLQQEKPMKEAKECVSRVSLPVEEEAPGYIRSKAPVLPNTCPRCVQSFQTQTALGAHHQLCSVTLTTNSETPEKKIAIQIRKDYQKDGAILTPQSEAQKETATSSQITIKVGKSQDLTNLKIQERIREVCVMERFFCLPCKKKYNSLHVLKRHVAHHIGWTRFSCALCSFKHYEKYLVSEHCLAAHKYKENNAESMILQEDNIDNPISLHSDKEISDGSSKSSSGETSRSKCTRKSTCVQNGDYENSECSASVKSEDSISIKSEFENQDNDSADVAYRELIENVDIGTENKEKVGIKERRNSDTKADRPHRTRKAVEQKDFVYESRSPIGSAENKNVAENSSRQRTSLQQALAKLDRVAKRKETSPEGEPDKKKSCTLMLSDNPEYNHCNGRESPSITTESVKNSPNRSPVDGKPKKKSSSDLPTDVQSTSPGKIFITDKGSTDKKIIEVKLCSVPSIMGKDETVKCSKIEKTAKIIRKIEGPLLKAKEGSGTELKLCKVKAIDCSSSKEQFKSKTLTLIEVKTKDRLEVLKKDQNEVKAERVEGVMKEEATRVKKKRECGRMKNGNKNHVESESKEVVESKNVTKEQRKFEECVKDLKNSDKSDSKKSVETKKQIISEGKEQ